MSASVPMPGGGGAMSGCGIDGEFCKVEEYDALQADFDVLHAAFIAMVTETPQGQACYRTSGGLPQGMPKRIERKAAKALEMLRRRYVEATS